MRTLSLLFPLLLLLFTACSKEDDMEISEAVYHEIPIDWTGMGWNFFTSTGVPTSHTGEVVEDEEIGGYVIKISNEVQGTGFFAAWRYSIQEPEIPIGEAVAFSAKLKLEEIRGSVVLIMRGDNQEKQEISLFATTQDKTSIMGTTDGYVEYRLPKVDAFPEGVDILSVYLAMGAETTGTVYLTDPKIVREP